jgi:hypothetical protein
MRAGISTNARAQTPPTKRPLTAAAYRDLDELRELRPELDQRIADAIPATGRGRPARPSAHTVWRGVLSRCCRAEGWPDAVIAAEIAWGDSRAKPYTIETLRQWELDVRQVERAEGVVTQNIRRDPQALRRVREALLAYGRRGADPEQEVLSRREVEEALAASGGADPHVVTVARARAIERRDEIATLAAEQAAEARRDGSRRYPMPG